jgi:hypothetical protein
MVSDSKRWIVETAMSRQILPAGTPAQRIEIFSQAMDDIVSGSFSLREKVRMRAI